MIWKILRFSGLDKNITIDFLYQGISHLKFPCFWLFYHFSIGVAKLSFSLSHFFFIHRLSISYILVLNPISIKIWGKLICTCHEKTFRFLIPDTVSTHLSSIWPSRYCAFLKILLKKQLASKNYFLALFQFQHSLRFGRDVYLPEMC